MESVSRGAGTYCSNAGKFKKIAPGPRTALAQNSSEVFRPPALFELLGPTGLREEVMRLTWLEQAQCEF